MSDTDCRPSLVGPSSSDAPPPDLDILQLFLRKGVVSSSYSSLGTNNDDLFSFSFSLAASSPPAGLPEKAVIRLFLRTRFDTGKGAVTDRAASGRVASGGA